MRTFQQVGSLRTSLRSLRNDGKAIAFVPTMGALHEGHLTLFRKAKSDCDLVIASIFVNPTQFGPGEDFQKYPRDLQHDLQLAASAGVDAVFTPEVEDIYPVGAQTVVDVPELSATLEGAIRPGHFRGVATVVAKLLNIVQPDCAYFGQKDYQQFLIVERMARDLHFSTTITLVPTVRDEDGLALSSRNVYLSAEQRQAAPILYHALERAQTLRDEGTTDAAAMQHEIEARIASEPLAVLEYAVVVHPDTLQPLTTLTDSPALVALAVRFGTTRLIDNALIAPAGAAAERKSR